tara:strand:- start:124 stop:1023 length:900 start_codon:yes stop_codon:yes gene_type:complete
MIPDIDNINIDSFNIPNINNISVGNVGIPNVYVRNIRTANVRKIDVPDINVWMEEPPQAIPPDVPVVVNIGKPIVNMPGCVRVHKENLKQRSKNKMLVNDDPKGNTVLCDAGAPYYQPVDYQSQGLTWTTVVPEEPEADGIDNNNETPDLPTPELPGAPTIPPTTAEEKECPGPKDLRVGDYATSGNEKVIGHEWNNDKTVCITLWEDVGFVEKYLPSANVVTTTATIAVVATSSALLAKPLADLLLKVIKPLVKKVSAKVKKVLGKTDPVLSVSERRAEQRDRNQAIRTLKKALKAKK